MVQLSLTSKALLVSVLASTWSSTSAFVPHNRPAAIGSSTFVPQQQHVSVVPHASTTALSMNLFDRFTRVAKANFNNILVAWEDPEKIMEQSLIDMQNDLARIRQSYAQVVGSQRRLLKKIEQTESMAQDWYNRAQLALKRNNEGLAREALARREMELEQVKAFQQQYDAQAASIEKLYEGMQTLEEKILQSKAKKDEMVARARTAKSTKQVNDMLAGITGKIQVLGGILSVTSTEAFSRMEEKVEALEAAAEASAEMGVMGFKALPGNTNKEPSLENQFKRLEQSAAVDDELKKLKGLLAGGSDSAAATRSYSSYGSSY